MYAMDTEVSCKIFSRNRSKQSGSVLNEIKRLEKKLSRYVKKSEVWKINNNAGKKPVKVSRDTFELLAESKKYSDLSNGLFDISIAPLINLWNYKNSVTVPEKDSIEITVSLVNYKDLILDERNQTVMLKKYGQAIDLGAIGKGFAADSCTALLESQGIGSAFICIGGSVSLIGRKPGGSLWNVGIRHPRKAGELIGVLQSESRHIVTSGDYERFFIDENGKRWHHILNPKTGYPMQSDIVSVTVAASSAVMADALSTIIFLSGINEVQKYIEQFADIQIIIVDEKLDIYISQGLKDYFNPTQNAEIYVIGGKKDNEKN